ncbi:MAG: glycosyltransferase [Actinoallomurus sp.]
MSPQYPPAPALDVVIPARDEAGRLPHGLELLSDKLAGLPLRGSIIVVDNASTDATAEIVEGWSGPVPVRLVRCTVPGKGMAVRAGLLATTAPYVGFCDADMATDLAALDEALALLSAGHLVVIGSRRHTGSVVEVYGRPLRRFGAVAFNRLVRHLTGGVTDTQCGFKFFTGPLARAAAADLRTPGFAFDVELLMHCRRRGAEAVEIPVVWHDVPGSTFSVWRHTFACLHELLHIHADTLRTPAAQRPHAVADELPAG